jgi:hypothetical protein
MLLAIEQGRFLRLQENGALGGCFRRAPSYRIVDYVDQAKTLKGATSANC